MARASTPTGLSIDEWGAILGFSPWELNNCSFPVAKSAQCTDVIYQYPWQRDHLSREEIAEAISDAERMLADELLYWPYPKYFVDEVVQYPRPHQREYWGWAGTPRGEMKSVQLKWMKIHEGGVFNRTSIGTISGADITKLDEDGDGIFETFEATITNAAIGSISNPYELALYFVAGNRLGEALSETWRIRPLTVTISGNTATFRGHRTLLVNPELENRVAAAPIDSALDANFVTEVECYRVFTDTTATEANPYQGVAIWKTIPDCTQDCTYETKELCLGEHNNAMGRVYASFGSQSTWPFADREPDRLQVNYLAGLPYDRATGQIPTEMARMITYLSVSLLANEKCGCDRSNRILAKWRKPITRFEDNTNGDNGAVAFTRNGTPYPMTVGGQYVWSRVKRQRELEVVSL